MYHPFNPIHDIFMIILGRVYYSVIIWVYRSMVDPEHTETEILHRGSAITIFTTEILHWYLPEKNGMPDDTEQTIYILRSGPYHWTTTIDFISQGLLEI